MGPLVVREIRTPPLGNLKTRVENRLAVGRKRELIGSLNQDRISKPDSEAEPAPTLELLRETGHWGALAAWRYEGERERCLATPFSRLSHEQDS